MTFYEQYFGERMNPVTEDELAVCCPFPHTDKRTGRTYYERRPSAHINRESRHFHCKVCGEGHSEETFLAKVEGIAYRDAVRLLSKMDEAPMGWDVFQSNLQESPEKLKELDKLGIRDQLEPLKLGYQGAGISFPVFVYDELLDVRTYNPEGKPKVTGERGSETLILPFDVWREDTRDTVVAAGEKDMAIARSKGFNAITFTGGEGSFPKLFKHQFKGRKMYVIYDNDFAGTEGSFKVAMLLKDAGAEVHIVDISQVCAEQGEDIHDFFMKYNGTAEELQDMMNDTPVFSDDEYQEERNRHYPLVKLQESLEGRYTNKVISSRVAVIADYEDAMEVPEVVEFYKFNEGDKCTIPRGETITWALDEENLRDLLKLCDSGLKDDEIRKNLKIMAGIPPKEGFLRMQYKVRSPVFKSIITDDMESEVETEANDEYKPFELTVYSVGRKLHNGTKYRLFYKRYAHPLQAQKMVAIATEIEDSDNSIHTFSVTPGVKENLKQFQTDNVSAKMEELAERGKDIAGVETRKDIFWFVDLFYHTPLRFNFGDRTERGYLDLMMIGESRTGKSQIAKRLLEMYELGVFTSLKTSTKAGLIGGSDKTSGGLKTKLGLIPRNHKGAVIMEEFSGGGQEIANALTEVRSSNKVRITRVNGTTTVDAMVRMMAISNQAKGTDGQTTPIRQYPNGIQVIQELVGAAEDIARYDLFLLVDEPQHYTRPNVNIELEAYDKQSYLDRVRWIWSRKPEQIIIDETTQNYIIDEAEELNRSYNTHVKFFGSEAWKKLARLAISVAAQLVSTDESFEHVVVKKEHVDWAKEYMVSCYDNQLFRLKQYVQNVRQYSEVDDISIREAQNLKNNHQTLVAQLEQSAQVSQSELKNMSGLANDDFAKIMNHLYKCRFIERKGEKIIPSERFRKSVAQAERVYLRSLKEGTRR